MPTLRAVFFDAAGTLIYLPRSVGEHYREVALRFGVVLEARALDHAFKRAFAAAPSRPSRAGAREDDDKGWWRDLVRRTLRQTLAAGEWQHFDHLEYFEAVYAHFTEKGVWQVFDDVHPTMQALQARGLLIGIISNFDRRLHTILNGLELNGYFDATILSSEVGADKPDPAIFQAALATLHVDATEAIHVGDDPKTDWGAEACGLQVFRLSRPQHGLAALLEKVVEGAWP